MKLRLGRRASTARDAGVLWTLTRDAFAAVVEPDHPLLDERAWRAAFEAGAHVVLVEGEEVAAFMRVLRPRHEVHIAELVVAPPFRRRGVGLALGRELIDEAIRADVPMSVHVPPRAGAAIACAKKLGFVVVPSREPRLSRLVWHT